MHETLLKAIADFEKAQKDYRKADAAQKAAKEAATIAWDAVRTNAKSFKEIKSDSGYNAAKAASDNERKAVIKSRIALAIYNAASQNVADAAANVLRDAIEANTKGLDKPVHYKAFKDAVNTILFDAFWLEASYNTVYIHYRAGQYGHDKKYVCNTDNSGLIDREHLAKQSRNHIAALEEIKAEAKKAAKDAAKLEKKMKELEELSNQTKAEYNTNIKWMLPTITTYSGISGGDLFK